MKDYPTNCTNYADFTLTGTVGGTFYSGMFGSPYNYSRKNCTNYGTQTINATIKTNCFPSHCCYDGAANATFVNCHNHGDIELTSEAKIAGAIRIGGMIANLEDAQPAESPTKFPHVTLDGCSNTGDIKISCQNSLGEGSNFYVAGCIASISKQTNFVVKNGLVNAGNITVDGGNKSSAVHMAGLIGTISSTVTTDLSGHLVNTGNFTFSGNTKTYLRIGGVVGVHSAASFTVPMINTGDITVTGTCDLTSASTQIGGITAAHTNPISNAQYYGNIKAIGYPQVGMITGKAYEEAILVSNSAIGGTICKDVETTTDDSGEEIKKEITETISAENLHKYVYGNEVDASVVTSVSVLTSAPSTEQPAPAPEEPEATPEA
jgi:hypothetical protein